MSETQPNTTDTDDGAQTDDNDDGPKPCRRLFAIPEQEGTMYTCRGCRHSMSKKSKFRELEGCLR